MIIAVCGSRKPASLSPPWRMPMAIMFLDQLLGADAAAGKITLLVEGGAEGFDRWAGAWALARGVPHKMEEADWKTHGLAAGPIRNQHIIDHFKPTLLIAFPGGKGTRDMVKRARAAGLRIVFPDPDAPLDARFAKVVASAGAFP